MKIFRLIIVFASIYLSLIGMATLFFSLQLNDFLGYSVSTSCVPWIQITAPMAIPLGIGLFISTKDIKRNIAMVQTVLIFSLAQILLDVYLIMSGSFRFSQIGFDLLVWAVVAFAVVAMYLPHTNLLNIRQLRPEGLSGSKIKLLRFSLGLISVYLLVGWILATFLPQQMNDFLHYSVSLSCLPWVQYGGPLSLGFGVALALSIDNPIRNILIVQVGIGGGILEILLDLYWLFNGIFKLWQLAADILLCTILVLALLLAYPKLKSMQYDE